MNWIAEAVVIFVTGMVVMGGPAWWMGRHSKRVPVSRLADETPFPYELPRAGRLELPAPNAGAQDPSFQVIPWDLAGAAYELGRQRAMQDEVSREVTAMIAEYDAKLASRADQGKR